MLYVCKFISKVCGKKKNQKFKNLYLFAVVVPCWKIMNLQQVEELCTALFTTTDSNARAEAGRKLELPQNDQGLLQCASLFESSTNYFTAVYALSTMKQIISRHRTNVSEKTAQTIRMRKHKHCFSSNAFSAIVIIFAVCCCCCWVSVLP